MEEPFAGWIVSAEMEDYCHGTTTRRSEGFLSPASCALIPQHIWNGMQ